MNRSAFWALVGSIVLVIATGVVAGLLTGNHHAYDVRPYNDTPIPSTGLRGTGLVTSPEKMTPVGVAEPFVPKGETAAGHGESGGHGSAGGHGETKAAPASH